MILNLITFKMHYMKNKVFKYTLIVISAIIVLAILSAGLFPPFNFYFYNDNNSIELLNSELFARYGDFVGGFLGTILTAGTILILIYYNNRQLNLIQSQIDKADLQHKDQMNQLRIQVLNNEVQSLENKVKELISSEILKIKNEGDIKDLFEFLLKNTSDSAFNKSYIDSFKQDIDEINNGYSFFITKLINCLTLLMESVNRKDNLENKKNGIESLGNLLDINIYLIVIGLAKYHKNKTCIDFIKNQNIFNDNDVLQYLKNTDIPEALIDITIAVGGETPKNFKEQIIDIIKEIKDDD